jgi:hypothetical protein
MTWLRSLMSMPRAAMSVATRNCSVFSRERFITRSRSRWVRSLEIASAS